MKRRIMVLLATVACLAAFGALLHSPPSFIDAFTGATPRAKKAAQEAAELEGKYVFVINTSAEGLEDQAVRQELKNIAAGDPESPGAAEEAADTAKETSAVKFHLYVSGSDYALKRYADALCTKLRQAGADVSVREYSNTMLRSRILSGQYQVFLASEDLVDVTQLKQADVVVLDSEEMTAYEHSDAAGRTAPETGKEEEEG